MAPRTFSGASIVGSVAWLVTSSAVTRILSLVAHWALGRLLVPNDFAAFAVALSVTSIAGAFRNGGAYELLISAAHRYEAVLPAALTLALAFNTVAFVVLSATSGFLADAYGIADAQILILVLASMFPAGTLVFAMRARLSLDGRFDVLARVSMIASLVRNLTLILLAWSGAGAQSFVWPVLLEIVLETALLVRHMGVSWIRWTASGTALASILPAMGILIVSSFALSVAGYGDYLVVGIVESSATLGLYFFAFQLLVALASVLNQAIEAVLAPTIANAAGDATRQTDIQVRSTLLVQAIVWPLCCLGFVNAHWIIDVLWSGKWNAAAPLVQCLIMSVPFWFLFSLSRASMEARGLWKIRLMVFVTYACGQILAPVIGSLCGGVLSIAISVSAFRAIFCLAQFWLYMRWAGVPSGELTKAVSAPAFSSWIALATVWAIHEPALSDHRNWGAAGGMVVVFLLLYVLMMRLIVYREIEELCTVYRRVRRRGAADY